jgi:chromosome segregation ATPase
VASATGIEELRELVRSDAELSGRGARLRDEDAVVARIRDRVAAIDSFFAALPDEEGRLGAAAAEAGRDLHRRREELAGAERELEEAHGEEERQLAESAVHRARDHVATADARLDRAQEARAQLAAEAAELRPELSRLEEQARSLAREHGELPVPASGAEALLEWASHARAELFVAAGQVDRQREQVIREANELASALLGEPTFGSTPAQALARVERDL